MAQKHPCCIDPSSNDEVATVGAKDGDKIEEGRKVETEIAGTMKPYRHQFLQL